MLYIALYVKFADPDHSGGTPAGGIVGIIWYAAFLPIQPVAPRVWRARGWLLTGPFCRIYIYAFGWSFGHSVAPYVTAAEIFPARIRSFSMSICLFVNWIVSTPSLVLPPVQSLCIALPVSPAQAAKAVRRHDSPTQHKAEANPECYRLTTASPRPPLS